MSDKNDLQTLDQATRLFFQTIKRPQTWSQLAQRAGTDVDRPSAVILHVLSEDPTKSYRLNDLAHRLGIEAPSVTRKTQELEAAGYLKRVPDPLDRRAVSLKATLSGQAISERLKAEQQKWFAAVIADWPAKERTQFVELFLRFSQRLADPNGTQTDTKEQ
jgi:DNA-binding MarR family transcriptional regulator